MTNLNSRLRASTVGLLLGWCAVHAAQGATPAGAAPGPKPSPIAADRDREAQAAKYLGVLDGWRSVNDVRLARCNALDPAGAAARTAALAAWRARNRAELARLDALIPPVAAKLLATEEDAATSPEAQVHAFVAAAAEKDWQESKPDERQAYCARFAEALAAADADGAPLRAEGYAALTRWLGSTASLDVAPRFPLPRLDATRRVLPNGLTVLVHEDHKAPVVTVQVTYRVGSRDETPGRTGFAHLYEHLMFQGSANYNQDYFRALQDAGALASNGATTHDHTTFFETVPTGALDRVLWLESDRMKSLLGTLDQARLDEQRGVVENEKREQEAAPYGLLSATLAKASWPAGHPYSWPIIGSRADLDAASLADVRAWFERYYGAANAVLAISGDVTPEAAIAKVERYFGAVPPGPPVNRLATTRPPPGAARTVTMTDTVPETLWTRVWNVPGGADPDSTFVEIIGEALAGNPGSPLRGRLVQKDRLASHVDVELQPHDLASHLVVSVRLVPGATPATEQAVDRVVTEELERYLARGPSSQAIARRRNKLFLRLARDLESSASTADWLSTCEVEYPHGLEECWADFERMNTITVADAQAAARRWLGRPAATLIVRPGPARTVSGLDAPAAALATAATATPPAAAGRVAPASGYAPPPLTPAQYAAHARLRVGRVDADRSRLPPLAAVGAGDAHLRLPPLKRARLSNGIPVFIAERHETPLVSVTWQSDVGDAAPEPSNKPLLLDAVYAQLSKGAAGRTGGEVDARLHLLGAELDSGGSLDGGTVSLEGLAATLENTLPYLADALRRPDYAPGMVALSQQQSLARVEQFSASMDGIMTLNRDRLTFGPRHPYGRFDQKELTLAGIRGTTPADLRAAYARAVRPDAGYFLVVGDVRPGEALARLEGAFGDWRPAPGVARLPRPAAPVPATGGHLYFFDRPGQEQSLISVTHAFAPDPGSRQALQLANAVVGGSFVSRLNMALREDKHWSYGVHSVLAEQDLAWATVIEAPVQADRTADALAVVAAEIDALRGPRPPTAAELASLRDGELRGLAGNTETTESVARLYAQILRHGWPVDYFDRAAARMQAVTDAQAAQAVRELLPPPAQLNWFVVGDAGAVGGPVAAFARRQGLVFSRLDVDGRPVEVPRAPPATPAPAGAPAAP